MLSNEKGFPAGLRPSYGLKAGYLVVAGSPDGVRRFRAPTGTAAGAEAPLCGSPPGTSVAIWKLTGKPLSRRPRGGPVRPAKEIEHELGELSVVLEAFDRMELRHTAGDGKVRLSLHVEFVEPLTK